MKIGEILTVTVCIVLLIADVSASPPAPSSGKIKIKTSILSAPKSVGDLLGVEWNFVYECERGEKITPIFARSYFENIPYHESHSSEKFIWIDVECNKEYSFNQQYSVGDYRLIAGAAIVELYTDKSNPDSRFAINRGEHKVFHLEGYSVPEKQITTLDTNNTIKIISDLPPPIEIDKVKPRKKIENKDDGSSRFSDNIIIDVSEVITVDTITLSLIPNQTFHVELKNWKGDEYKIINKSKANILNKTPIGFDIMSEKKLNDDIILLEFNESKKIHFQLKSVWQLDGTFKFNDPFGTNDNRLEYVDCQFYEWVNNTWQYVTTGYTDAEGYFHFLTDKDTVGVWAFSINNYAWCFYDIDECFRPGTGEDLSYHIYGVGVFGNINHIDYTIPEATTTITDSQRSGAFHILNVIRNGFQSYGYGWLYNNAPVYYGDTDWCVTSSGFGGYFADGVLGIQIVGTIGGINDCDQWDSSIILHEFGHFFHYDQAELTPYVGLPDSVDHYFTEPVNFADVNDLYLAWEEGWATFFACAARQDLYFKNYLTNIPNLAYNINLEQPEPDVPFYDASYNQTAPSSTNPLYEGAHVEGAVAIALWDLYDAANDGNYYVGPDIWGHNSDYNSGESWQGLNAFMDVFYNYDPQPDNPDHDYCWNVYEFIHGWRKLGYPIDSTFINIFEAHNVPVFIPGDFTDDGIVNLFDVSYFVSYLYLGGNPPSHMSAADANADCDVNLLDATYIQSFLYLNGSEPLVGCYNMYPN